MKKFDLLKILGISFGIALILSWIIPAGLYSGGVYAPYNATAPIGLYDILRLPTITIATFIQYGLVFLAIGGFYGVLNKIGILATVVANITKKVAKKQTLFLVITAVGFALLSSLTALPTLLFVFVPLFVAVLLSLGFNKLTTFAATVGALLVGQIGSVFGFNLWGYLVVFLEMKMTTLIWARVILFVITTGLFTFVLIKNNKPKKKTKEEKNDTKVLDIPLYENKTTKKNLIPFIVIYVLMFIVLILGMYNWYYALDSTVFSNLHETIMSFKVSDYSIFTNLLGSVSELGFWGNYDLVIILILASLLLGWIYNVKFNDTLEGFKSGMKKMLVPAFYAMLASVLFTVILNMQNGNFVVTIFDKIINITEGFNVFTASLSSVIASIFYNDFYSLVNSFYGVYALYDVDLIPIVSLIVQSIYGLVMVIAPMSIFLLAGLKYMEIPYKDWIKYIWKFVLIMLVVIISFSFILTLI